MKQYITLFIIIVNLTLFSQTKMDVKEITSIKLKSVEQIYGQFTENKNCEIIRSGEDEKNAGITFFDKSTKLFWSLNYSIDTKELNTLIITSEDINFYNVLLKDCNKNMIKHPTSIWFKNDDIIVMFTPKSEGITMYSVLFQFK